MESDERRISTGRAVIRSVWKDIDFGTTDQAKKAPQPPQEKAFDEKGTLVDLPRRDDLTIGAMTIRQAIWGRKSRRKFSGAPLTLEELAFLLYATQGVRKRMPERSLRTVPSAGAQHSFETYLYVDKVEGVPRGLYRYLPFEHRLYLIEDHRPGMEKELDEALLKQFWDAAAVFIWSTIPYRMEWRYSFASAKLIALDAGHVCENLYLACEALGCGTCGIGAYDQEKIDRFIQVDGVEEFAIYMAPVGKQMEGERIQ